MRNAKDIMIKIGRIVNFVLLGLGVLLFVIGAVGVGLEAAGIDNALVVDAASRLGYGIWLIIANVIALVIIKKAEAIIFNGQDNVIKGSVIEIIIGVISNNPFYILSGIFAIIIKDDINKESQAKAADAEEAPVAEDAFAGEAEAEAEPVAEAEVVEEVPAEIEEEKKDEE